MLTKIKSVLKKTIIVTLCVTTLTSAIVSSIPIAKADSSSILGTNAALGSPILNENFTIDNWNKWEIICWGVFLSNFCQPLIDNYNSAFKATGEGSNGAGYAALCFGSGSDLANNEVIEAFCDYAIMQSTASKKEIWVAFTEVSNGVIGEKPNPNNMTEADKNSDKLRIAKFEDLFISVYDGTENKTSLMINTYIINDAYQRMEGISEGYLPTFYIKNQDNKYIEILDYTNSWDIQAFTSIINAVRKDNELQSQFEKNYESLKSSSPQLYFDTFGNIVVNDGIMVFPSAANQHLTKDKTINVLNSWMMNGYTSTYSSDKLIQGLRQNIRCNFWSAESYHSKVGGYPAFGESDIGSVGLFYYDLDAIILNDYFTNGQLPDYGDLLKKLFSLDISSTNNKYPLKFEISDNGVSRHVEMFKADAGLGDFGIMVVLASMIPNSTKVETQPKILHELVLRDGTKVSLFSDKPVVIANQLLTESQDKGIKGSAEALRAFFNYFYQAYMGNTSETTFGTFDHAAALSILEDVDTVEDFAEAVDNQNLWNHFTKSNEKYKNAKLKASDWDIFWDKNNNETLNSAVSRLCVVYPISDTMKAVSSVLGLQDGTEFNVYSTILYMTYLDWYGVLNQTTLTSGTEAVSNFSTEIFDDSYDILKLDPSSLADMKSSEEKEEEVLNMSYLMLHPEAGRSYRKELLYNGVSDFLYEQYNRIVYGGSSSTYSGSASKSNSGFLAIETYSENWLTSWFLENYVDIAVWLIAICCVLIIVLGLLKSRRASWYFMSFITAVTVILIIPSSGEIVPYVTSSFVQSMFSNKMTYWSISEGIANASLEADAASQSGDFDGLSDEDASAVISMVKQLNVVYLDRSLMLKQDISQKLTQELGGIYTEIQNLQSARWILPMIMEQFTGDDGTTEYLYVKLSNVWDDGTNFYWYYNQADVSTVTKPTTTSEQFFSASSAVIQANIADDTEKYTQGKQNMYQNATMVDEWSDDTLTDINYANFSYTVKGDEDDIVHLYSYLLPGVQVLDRRQVFGDDASGYGDVDSWQQYIDWSKDNGVKNAWLTTKTDGFEEISGTYDRTDASTLKPGYSYYKTTESPYYYFFNVVKDSFDSQSSLGSVIGNLQGEIENTTDGAGNLTETEVRSNFMYATKTTDREMTDKGKITNADVAYTGYVRDCLDLQEFFTNTVPYLYQATLTAGGFDGESGILVDSVTDSYGNVTETPLKISSESTYYEGQNQSWAYRCNWAVKLMENPNYAKPMKIKDKNGNVYTVQNPLLVECYPGYDQGRPMIFSEAQMYAYGLQESDLNLVELKCIEVNKQIAKKWTLLINYAGTSGLTKEVVFRQMAIDATEIFCTEFSSGGLINNMYSIYPQSIDLRYLSFDSVMKMLMINVSKDTSYVYGDTMSTLLEDTDLGTAALLLISAFLCAYVVPLMRTLLMALIFYLGFMAIIRALFSSNKYKGEIACGQLVSNLLFMGYTLVYYACFCGMMAISSSDEVLSVDKIQSNAGNPVWILLAIIIASAVYIVCMFKQIKFCFAHFRDMGFEMYSTMASAITGKLSDALGSVKDKISDFANSGGSTEVNQTTNTNSLKGTGIMKDKAQDVNIKQSYGSNITVSQTPEDELEVPDDMYTTAYESDEGSEYIDTTDASDIDAQIKTGEEMDTDIDA